MSSFDAGLIFVLSLFAALAVAYRYLGDYVFRVVTGTRHSRVERGVYRLFGADPAREQSWVQYAGSLLAFSGISILFLYAFLRLQGKLGWLSNGLPGVPDHLAWNVAVSFVTNANWQAYSGESTMGHLVQMTGFGVQQFASAGVGIAVAVVLVRGFARSQTDRLGNFWVDLTRIILRILLPFSVLIAIVLIVGGVVQNLSAGAEVSTLTGGSQTITGGPVASWEAIKLLGTNGGGFYNVNSAHPFENPSGWTNWLELFLLLCIPVSLVRVYGRMVGQNRQGYAILAVFAILVLASGTLLNIFESAGHGTVPQAVGAALEGKDVRFGVQQSAIFAALNTVGSGGVAISSHDSYTALGGGLLMLNIMLGGLGIGAVGTGLYGYLIFAMTTAKLAGLMVGRTPEFLGKKVSVREMKLVSLYTLVPPVLTLTGTAAAFMTGHNSTALNVGPHGLSEVLYAFTSASTANGSSFAGIAVNTPWWNVALGLIILFGRFLAIIVVLALAGTLARRQTIPVSAGTLPTDTPLFVGMVVAVTVILTSLTYLPALALGPLAEAL
ncbi:potassium-transporting ATPase subunit KdpA [Planotetraspora phitsanulokensis]|uniref:Potassium-transporting ATPase potassium-binding subunit n=1 Tax=Planotetraspora phitsanulokensis TaxID=575192 RepID=A0A8J3XCB1_9ACTN|nr:potassium-transporting ATPase subunit KdpA [Planotetraspora phitsanulokensis]GII35932.1 potassium-transporting ATPase potassium-binding subunit [Planotetraspora phitsanulokensis]